MKSLAPRAGFEPATNRLTAGCSTAELPGKTCSRRAYIKADPLLKAAYRLLALFSYLAVYANRLAFPKRVLFRRVSARRRRMIFAGKPSTSPARLRRFLRSYATAGAWRGLSKTRKPYFVFAHGSLDPWACRVQPIKGHLKQIYWTLVLGRILAGARAVLFTTEEECRRARATYQGYSYRERVVAYGTAQVPEDARTQVAAFHTAVPRLGERRYLLLLSRIHPKKGTDLLIRAFARFADQHQDHDLVIAGPDEIGWQTMLQRLGDHLGLKDRIHWPGWLSGEAKWGAFRGAEAFVLPSHQENFGIVVAEAASCGTPILLTDQVNTWAEVSASGAGLVARDNQKGIEDLLHRFFALSREERQRMTLAARRCFAKHFDIARGTGPHRFDRR